MLFAKKVNLIETENTKAVLCFFERRTSNPLLQMRGALSRGNGGCSCQIGIRKPHLTSCGATCVHEKVETADFECLLYYFRHIFFLILYNKNINIYIFRKTRII